MKKKIVILIPLVIFLGLLYNSCKDIPPAAETGGGGTPVHTATITGRALDAQTSAPVSRATVRLIQTTRSINASDSTASDGSFSFTVDLGDTFTTTGQLTITKSGYRTKTTTVSLIPGQTNSLPDIAVDRDTTVVIGGGSGTTYPNTIALISSNITDLSVYGVGGTETAIITFEVRDSLGVPIDIDHQDTVIFNVNPPAIGHVSPAATLTNAAGRVATVLSSDTIAGTVQVVAKLRRDTDGRIIQSEPVRVVVHAGFPDQAHFTLGATMYNFAGYDWVARTNQIQVLVGDKFSNPVQPGTAIYFSSTGGVINASGFTSSNGQTMTTLYSGNPRPVTRLDSVRYSTSLYGNDTGYAWIRASTVSAGGTIVGDSLLMLFSGQAQVTYRVEGTDPTLICFTRAGSGNQGRQRVFVSVSDRFGNPLSQATTVSGLLDVVSDSAVVVNFTGLPDQPFDDFITRGTGRTDFTVTVYDATVGGAKGSVSFTLRITVTGPNGTAFVTIPGRIRQPTDLPCP